MRPRTILYTGKGGVGKTSVAAATARRCAAQGLKTLVISTDPAHSLADVLQAEVGGEPTKVAKRLRAQQVQAQDELEHHWSAVSEWLGSLLIERGVDRIAAEELTVPPGGDELFSLLKVREYADRGSYDVIIIDCAPTGETVRMLGVPEILGFYFKRIFPIQKTVLKGVRPVARRMTDMPLPSDDVFTAVQGIYRQLEGMAPLLQDPARSSIRIVLNPEDDYGVIAFLALFTILLLRGWVTKPLFLRRATVMFWPLFGLTMLFGWIDELRDYYELYIVAMPLIAMTVARDLDVPVYARERPLGPGATI